jgi:hypothetical protein
MKRTVPVAGMGLVLLLSACGGSPPSPPTTSRTPGTLPAPGTSAPRTPSLPPGAPATGGLPPTTSLTGKEEVSRLGSRTVAGYEAGGRRDPFELPEAIEGSIGATVTSAKLTGIIRTAAGRVLVLIETPDGLGYVLQPGDVFGDGRLVEVGQGSAVFTVVSRHDAANHRVVLRLGG